MRFDCPFCGEPHRLADYLAIGADAPDDWATEEVASALRDALEALTLFHFVKKYNRIPVIGSTMFGKDGPLLLRAALSRLVVPIRDFVGWLRDQKEPLCLWGRENRNNG
jgi:hypothetical protein